MDDHLQVFHVVAEHQVDQRLQLRRILGEVEHDLFEAPEVGQPQVHEPVLELGRGVGRLPELAHHFTRGAPGGR